MHIKHVYSENIEYTDVKITNKYTVLNIYIYIVCIYPGRTPQTNIDPTKISIIFWLRMHQVGILYSVILQTKKSCMYSIPFTWMILGDLLTATKKKATNLQLQNVPALRSIIRPAGPGPPSCARFSRSPRKAKSPGAGREKNNMTLSPPEK